MSDQPQLVGARALIRELGDCFESRGWRDDDNCALTLTEQARDTGGALDVSAAVAAAPASFMTRNGIGHSQLRQAISSVFAGRQLLPAERDYPSAITNSFEINGDGNVVSNVNLGGQQYNLTNGSSANEVIAAIRDLLVEALDSGLSDSALTTLGQYIETRPDIDQSQVESAAREVVAQLEPDTTKLAQLRDAVAASTTSGLLVQGVTAALGAML